MATHRLWIPFWRPVPLNSVRNKHWAVEFRAKKKTAGVLVNAAVVCWVPGAKGPRSVQVHTVLRPRARAYDCDAMQKILLDSLKQAGLIVDDRPGMVRWLEPTHERGTAERWGTLITLEDV